MSITRRGLMAAFAAFGSAPAFGKAALEKVALDMPTPPFDDFPENAGIDPRIRSARRALEEHFTRQFPVEVAVQVREKKSWSPIYKQHVALRERRILSAVERALNDEKLAEKVFRILEQ